MRLRVGMVLLLVVVAVAAWSYLRPIPAVAASPALPATDVVPGTAPPLPWPGRGSAALSISGLGFIGTSGNEQPAPAESVTKVMTALLILEDKPLRPGESGPIITITDADVESYRVDVADKESVVLVKSGEQISEVQALEGLLIPSANNLADTLARWDVGSVAAFVTRMNTRAKGLGLTHTTFADTSGANPLSVSTPSDLMALGIVAMKQDVFAQVVAMGQADLPVAGTVYNFDAVLGQEGIIGMKTGSGLDSGANFLFAASLPVDGHPAKLFGCVMGQTTLAAAFSAAKLLLAAAQAALHVRRVIARNQTIATYSTPWGPQTDLVSTMDVDLLEWPGMVLRQRLQAPSIVVDQPLPASTKEGVEHVVLGDYVLDVPLATAGPLYPPGRFWRLTRFGV
jgi:D-alanyl-D-alanine carboxypeptidase (penicillin-binding protein 5/6)